MPLNNPILNKTKSPRKPRALRAKKQTSTTKPKAPKAGHIDNSKYWQSIFDRAKDGPVEIRIPEKDLKEVLGRFSKEFDQKISDIDWHELNKILNDVEDNLSTINKQKQPINNLNSLLEEGANMSKNGWITEGNGIRKCLKDGELHALNGPAEIRPNGTQLFYQNGKLHRAGGMPAMIGSRGTQKYAVDGKYHRLGGLPAIIWSRGPFAQEWWENGEIKKAIKRDGTREWYAPGSTDRDEAVLHRTDGPAVIHPNGIEEFWVQGVQYSREEWFNILNNSYVPQEASTERAERISSENSIDDFIKEETVVEKKPTEKKMSEKPSVTEMLKSNFDDAKYRVAGTQLTKIVKGGILQAMQKKGHDNGHVAAIAAFLDTEFGDALVAGLLGFGLNYVPKFGEDPRVMRLADELRTNSMAVAGNAIIGEAVEHILPAITQVLNQLPSTNNSAVVETTNLRVEAPQKTSQLAERLAQEEEESESVQESEKKMSMKA